MLLNILFYAFLCYLLRYFIFPLILIFINYYIRINFEKYIKLIQSSGEWAVVTGGTDGIGKEYCRQLAKLGMKIFLISRDKKKLESTSKEIQHYYNVDVKYFKTDFTSDSIYEDLNHALKDLDIGVLVNNVGMTQNYPCYFHELNENFSFLSNFINCNILSAIGMSKIVLPGMCLRKRGIIINISSMSSLAPMPMVALYTSCKTFLSNFSIICNEELKNSRILVQLVRPSYVQTKFIGKFRPLFIHLPSAEEYVKSAIQTIGIESDTYGTVGHSIQGMFVTSAPVFIILKMFDYINKKRCKAVFKD